MKFSWFCCCFMASGLTLCRQGLWWFFTMAGAEGWGWNFISAFNWEIHLWQVVYFSRYKCFIYNSYAHTFMYYMFYHAWNYHISPHKASVFSIFLFGQTLYLKRILKIMDISILIANPNKKTKAFLKLNWLFMPCKMLSKFLWVQLSLSFDILTMLIIGG